MALADQVAGRAIGAGIIIEIKPRVGLRQAAAAKSEEGESAGEQLRQTRIVIQRVRHDQRVDPPALHHAHITMFIRLLIIRDQQQINFITRQLMANLPDHLKKHRVIQRSRTHGEHQTHGIDFAHFKTPGEGIGPIAAAFCLRLNAGARLLRHVVVAV